MGIFNRPIPLVGGAFDGAIHQCQIGDYEIVCRQGRLESLYVFRAGPTEALDRYRFVRTYCVDPNECANEQRGK